MAKPFRADRNVVSKRLRLSDKSPSALANPPRAYPEHAIIRPFPKARELSMDIEHINQIGNHIADLAARTEALRGYL
jgi:hypothetical protein